MEFGRLSLDFEGGGKGGTVVAAIFQKTEERKGRESVDVNGTFVRAPRASKWRGSKEEKEREEEVSINSITRE